MQAMNVVEALHHELVRNKEILGRYEAIGPAGVFGAMMIKRAIAAGEAALGSGEAVDMVRALAELRETSE